VLEKHQLGRSAAKQHRHLVFELHPRHQETIFGRALYRVAERPNPARDD